jgi:two-component system, LuxR family, response regulator FixJ
VAAAASQTVYVIDDESATRTTTSHMVGATEIPGRSFTPHPFAGGADFIEALDFLKPGCLLLDLRMPGMDGFQLMEELRRRGIDWPVVVMTGASDVPNAVQAMKLGAFDFLEKPMRLEALEATLGAAATELERRVAESERRRAAESRVAQLSPREQEVLRGLMAGRSNKELAEELGIGLRTVEMHRGNMMDHLGVATVAQAVAVAIEAGLRAPD